VLNSVLFHLKDFPWWFQGADGSPIPIALLYSTAPQTPQQYGKRIILISMYSTDLNRILIPSFKVHKNCNFHGNSTGIPRNSMRFQKIFRPSHSALCSSLMSAKVMEFRSFWVATFTWTSQNMGISDLVRIVWQFHILSTLGLSYYIYIPSFYSGFSHIFLWFSHFNRHFWVRDFRIPVACSRAFTFSWLSVLPNASTQKTWRKISQK